MAQKLIIVESPSKAKTIESYLGKDYQVLSSKGHIRDLATSGVGGFGVDVENNFEPTYTIIRGKAGVVTELKKAAKNKEVLIATDPDREGEAIGWHVAQELGLDVTKNNRVVFREITKKSINEAITKARPIDQGLVSSQETRRILDRIIGFRLSNLLQSKISSKSAGRVQSVALKLIVDLEKEILAFIPEEYNDIKAHFPEFIADYIITDKRRIKADEAKKIVSESKNPFEVTKIERRESIRKSRPAFITSTLQQDAIQTLSLSAARTMMVAQSLYEGKKINGEIIGLITYMRTDSTRLSNEFIDEAEKHIKKEFGNDYYGTYKKSATVASQDAHEAIRPTSLTLTPQLLEKDLSKDELKLYTRIYERAVASLMADAKIAVTKYTLTTNGHDYLAEGSVLTFEGHYRMLKEQTKDKVIPNLDEQQKLAVDKVEAIKKFTTPPARYSEATLIKELESNGIGRPSTYSTIIQTLKNRAYVEMEVKRFKPTEQGTLTSEQLDKFFDSIINVEYTSSMEKTLDEISDGKHDSVNVLREFYNQFIPMVDFAFKNMEKIAPEPTGEKCPVCGGPLVTRKGRYGDFIGCGLYPECKYIQKEKPKETGNPCPKCGKPLVVRKGPKANFIGCSTYPKCDYTDYQ